MPEAKRSEQLSTVVNAMNVVELISNEGKLNLTQISHKLDIGLTASHRLVHTLTAQGWLAKDSENAYQLGSKVFGIATAMQETTHLNELVRPILMDLWERTSETIHLTKLDGRSIVYLDQVVSPRPVHSVSIVGGRSPAHSVSPGLSQIATQDEEYLEWFLSKPLKKHTENTITDRSAFLAHLDEVRDQGYAVNLGGYREDVGGVSVAVTRPDGKALIALSVCAPVYRLKSTDKEQLGRLLKSSAAKVVALLPTRASATPPANNA